LYREIGKKALPDSEKEIENMADADFSGLVTEYRIFFKSLGLIKKIAINHHKTKIF